MTPLNRTRINIVAGAMTLAFVALVGRAWHIQVHRADTMLERHQWRDRSTQSIQAPRGSITDRHGRVLAESVRTMTLVFDPYYFFSQMPDRAGDLNRLLSGFEGYDPEELIEWSQTPLQDLKRYHVLARGLPPGDVDAIVEEFEANGLGGVYGEASWNRVYPARTMSAHTLGFVNYTGVEGATGLEARMNDVLKGDQFELSLLRDSRRRGYLQGELPDIEAASGADVELTIDSRLTRFADRGLRNTVLRHRAERGMAVVTRVDTGEILALSSYPTFDLNDPQSVEPEAWRQPAVSHLYEPGSTAKMFTLAAAINEGQIHYDSMIDCENGLVHVADATIRDTHPSGVIPAWQVLQVSSNIGAYKIGDTITSEVHREYLRGFGFGERPDVEIAGADAGLLHRAPWGPVEHANVSFGHYFMVSALQLNLATAAIANGGVLMKPMLVKRIYYGDGTIETREPEERRRVVRAETAREVTRALESVLDGEAGGTGSLAAIEGVRVAGKTGTAEIYNNETGAYEDEYVSSFTGFLPAEAPEFAITVWIVRPDRDVAHYGGHVAAPLFSSIGREALRLYGTPTDEVEHSLAATIERYPIRGDVIDERPSAIEATELNPDEVPDFTGMWVHDALATARTAGLELNISGSGRVVAQEPSAGTSLAAAQRIRLSLERGGELL